MARRQQQAGGRGRSGAAGQGGRTRGQQQGQRSGQRQGFSPSRGGRPQGGYGARQQGRGGQRPQGRNSAGRSDLIEGRRAVEEALGAGVPLKSALVQIQSLDADPALERLAQRLGAAGVSVERVPRNRLDQLSSHGAHQGVIVRAKPFQYVELGDVIAAAGKGNALVLVLDHVTDEGNFGAIVRTAEVVGAAGVVIAKARSASVGVGAYKTSAGAVLHIPIAQVSNLARAVEELKAAGFWSCASTEHAKDDVWSAPLAGRVALVMGSEGEGISRLVLEKCDFACKLPQRGRVESLNVAQACTVMCYEWLRREMTGEGARGV
ncbi:MAG: 23S rRNA (guanosine(2251)-2'-O)-methyltransferase RlmB [Paratractidigestivibacter faecalis]|uniref:23S rRNA (guanosine(2251)-2'-O)-methyltransferase RlmB n=1 Tax=Paratractidigestivibacter faecalis TaxID=2292441 RepID=UPI002A9089D0|nr:23S rRNA (guanosine(2251)-2'-O)-methyltransferase RlmB [Paratractidigestivibacter faecalis]MDY6014491.1 23S rRNA (guanosine(2251)-2'-O)-methyltransferase RlmB [Paratractidigestivibacter faecalis]